MWDQILNDNLKFVNKMKDLKSIFDGAELKVLYNIFSMAKFGVDDEYRMLRIISSAIFKDLFDAVNVDYITSANKNLPDNYKEPLARYIEEQKDILLQTLKENVSKCFEMYKCDPESNWSEWQEDWKRSLIINLASPYLIRESTINEILADVEG